MIRNWLREWLGIADPSGFEQRIKALEQLRQDSINKSNALSAALQEMRQLREQVLDPKKIPVQTRNSRQFRALVEQDIGG